MVDRKCLQQEINLLSEVMVRARKDASRIAAELDESGKLVFEIQKKKIASLIVTGAVYRGFYE